MKTILQIEDNYANKRLVERVGKNAHRRSDRLAGGHRLPNGRQLWL